MPTQLCKSTLRFTEFLQSNRWQAGTCSTKIANNEYRWTWTVPVTAKLKMGSSLRNFQCFEIILLFDFKVLVAKSLSQILDNCIVIVFYFKPKRSVIIKIIIKWVAFVTFLSCYKDCSIIWKAISIIYSPHINFIFYVFGIFEYDIVFCIFIDSKTLVTGCK